MEVILDPLFSSPGAIHIKGGKERVQGLDWTPGITDSL